MHLTIYSVSLSYNMFVTLNKHFFFTNWDVHLSFIVVVVVFFCSFVPVTIVMTVWQRWFLFFITQ